MYNINYYVSNPIQCDIYYYMLRPCKNGIE